MLITLASWLVLLIITQSFSKAFLKAIKTSLDSDDFFLVRQYIGLNILATGLLAFSIFSSINAGILPFIFLGSLFFYKEEIRKFFKDVLNSWKLKSSIFFFLAAFIHSAYSTQVIYLGDTGGYHFGFVKWLSEFGVVPGLAHLEPRFGFGSSWLTLTSLFNHHFLEGRSGALINGYLFLCCSIQIYLFNKNKSFDIANIFLIFSLILVTPYSLRSGVILSPSPDFPIHLLGPLVVFIVLKHTKSEVNLLLLLASMTFNVKLSSLPLFIWAGLRKLSNFTSYKIFLVIAVFVVLPICIVNFITSGYPLYPSTLIHMNADWALPINVVKQIKTDIYTYAAFTPNHWLEIDYRSTSFINKVYVWSTSRHEFITFLLIIFSIASFIHLKACISDENGVNLNAISLLSFAGIAFFIITAPTIRFGLQWLVILPSLSIAYVIHTYNLLNKGVCLSTSSFIPFLALLFIAFPIANTQKLIYSAIDNKIIEFQDNSSFNFFTPPLLPNLVTEDDLITKTASKIKPLLSNKNEEGINIAQGPQCWNTPIPCATMMNFEVFNTNRWHKSGFKQKGQTD